MILFLQAKKDSGDSSGESDKEHPQKKLNALNLVFTFLFADVIILFLIVAVLETKSMQNGVCFLYICIVLSRVLILFVQSFIIPKPNSIIVGNLSEDVDTNQL